MERSIKRSQSILVVDDQKINLSFISMNLKKAGFRNIITCQDSRKVMDILSETHVDVLLSDLNMPYIDGEELLSIMSDRYPDIPVLIVSAETRIEIVVRCMKKGAYDYVTKPINTILLINQTKQALAFKELKEENYNSKKQIQIDSIKENEAFQEICTQNKKMLSIFKNIMSDAATSQPRNNQSKAAKILGISQFALNKYLRKEDEEPEVIKQNNIFSADFLPFDYKGYEMKSNDYYNIGEDSMTLYKFCLK